jgi:DNA-binding Lrp family transcriptional regulator
MQEAIDAEAKYPERIQAAKALGIPHATFQNRVRRAQAAGVIVSAGVVNANNPELLHRQIKRLEGDLNAARKIAAGQDDNLVLLKNLIRDCDVTPTPPKWLAKPTTGKNTGAPVLFLSDIHYDEIVLANQINGANAYTREIANRRLKRFFQKTIDLLVHHMAKPNYDYCVLDLGGDMVSGNIHEELRETNEAPVSQSILALMDQLVAGIDSLLPHFPRIVVNGVVGNHGRWDKKPRMKNRVYENYEWLLYQFLAKYYADNKDIVFNIADGADLIYSVYNFKTCLTHGDQFRGGSGVSGNLSPLMLGDVRKRKRALALNQPFDLLKMGHWHTLWHAKGIMVNGSVKGYDEYSSQMNFDYEVPQQWLYVIHPVWGITARWPVLLERPGTKF